MNKIVFGIIIKSGVIRMIKMKLTQNWILNYNGSDPTRRSISVNVEIPSTVFESLLKNGLIEDPFYGLNEDTVRWVYESDWLYKTYFNVPEQLMRMKKIVLKFYGLDTLADIYLNGSKIASTNNMFRTYEFDVKNILKPEQNELKIYFKSPTNYTKSEIKRNGHKLQIGSVGIPGVQYIRKAQYSFGWDWGPKLPDIGIWKEIELIGYDGPRIKTVYIKQNFRYHNNIMNLGDLGDIDKIRIDYVDLLIKIELDYDKLLDISSETKYIIRVILTDPNNQEISTQKEINARINKINGNNEFIELELRVHKPYLWWSHDLGEPHLYKLEINLLKNNKIIDSNSLKIGIRDLRLIRRPDKWGESFYFLLNGVPVFAKGANWIPIDNFIPRGKKLGLYKKLIEATKEANMNMLRVWGGGIYEDDEFYNLCDENGIIIWQDFMFACGIYPSTNEFIENVEKEAIDNILRLRNHPCIALWCGNNEVEWFLGINLILLFIPKFKFKKKREYKRGYFHIFEELLPELVQKYDPQRQYWPSSPSNGSMFHPNEKKRGILKSNSPKKGDAHYWDVWHLNKPFKAYRKFTPRFMSEFGFESFPDLKTINYFCPSDQLHVYSKIMEAHQKNPAGNKKLINYTKRRFKVPKNFEKMVFLSQITQGDAIEYGVEHWRRNRVNNRCGGALYWQLNDCWPVASWSSIDYFIRWKALHYFAKRFFMPLFPSVEESKKDVKIYITNDSIKKKDGILEWRISDVNGFNFVKKSQEFSVLPCTTIKLDELKIKNIKGLQQKIQDCIIIYKLFDMENRLLYKGFRLFGNPKKIHLKDPKIEWKLKDIGKNKFEMSLSAKEIALYVIINSNKYDFKLSDNFFLLDKNEIYNIIIKTDKDISEKDLINSISVISLYDLMNQ